MLTRKWHTLDYLCQAITYRPCKYSHTHFKSLNSLISWHKRSAMDDIVVMQNTMSARCSYTFHGLICPERKVAVFARETYKIDLTILAMSETKVTFLAIKSAIDEMES